MNQPRAQPPGITSGSRGRIRRPVSMTGECRAATVEFADVMPSGAKIRSRTASSQLLPVILSTRYPAVRTIALSYWKPVRESLFGSRSRSRPTISLREASALHQRRSWRGMLERCVTRSTGVIHSEATASSSANSGVQLRTGSCHSSLPSSTRVAIVNVVNAFVQESTAKTVVPVAGSDVSRSRRPWPLARRISSPLTIATETAGTFHFARSASTLASKAAGGAPVLVGGEAATPEVATSRTVETPLTNAVRTIGSMPVSRFVSGNAAFRSASATPCGCRTHRTPRGRDPWFRSSGASRAGTASPEARRTPRPRRVP